MRMKPAGLSLVAGPLLAACARPVAPASSPPAASLPSDAAPRSWSQVVEAANREGRLVVWSQTGTPTSDAVAGAFEQAFPDITVEYTGLSGAQTVTKLLTERAAGIFGVDLLDPKWKGKIAMLDPRIPGAGLATSGYPSRRLHTSKENLPDSVIPRPEVQYRDLSKERYIRLQEEVTGYLKTLIPD